VALSAGLTQGQTVGSVGAGKKITYITRLLSKLFVSLDSGKQGMIKANSYLSGASILQKNNRSTNLLSVCYFFILNFPVEK